MSFPGLRGSIATLCLLAAPAAPAPPKGIPVGWRSPEAVEVTQAWRSSGAHRYLTISADFDGDGRTDVARLLVRVTSPEVALVVVPGRPGMEPIVLKRLPDASVLEDVGIDIVEPGEYRTACGKGYWKCGEWEPDKLTLTQPAIDAFVHEKADSFFFFDSATQTFREVLISD